MLLTRLLSPKKLRSKTEIKVKKKVPLKKTQFSTTRQEERSIVEPPGEKDERLQNDNNNGRTNWGNATEKNKGEREREKRLNNS